MKTDRIRKQVTKILKEIGFKTEIKANLKVVDFLDITCNLCNNTNLTENPTIIYCTLIRPPTIRPKLSSTYLHQGSQHQQPKDFPKILQV